MGLEEPKKKKKNQTAEADREPSPPNIQKRRSP